MPPNDGLHEHTPRLSSDGVTRAVRAPAADVSTLTVVEITHVDVQRAAAALASVPAWPPPITTTSKEREALQRSAKLPRAGAHIPQVTNSCKGAPFPQASPACNRGPRCEQELGASWRKHLSRMAAGTKAAGETPPSRMSWQPRVTRARIARHPHPPCTARKPRSPESHPKARVPGSSGNRVLPSAQAGQAGSSGTSRRAAGLLCPHKIALFRGPRRPL